MMTGMLDALSSYLSNGLEGIDVQHGYLSSSLESPLTSPKVFIIFRKIGGGSMDISLFVYTPAALGGLEAGRTAERISELLADEMCPFGFENITIGQAEYHRESRAFSCEIRFCISESQSMRYYFTADHFSDNPGFSISCRIPHYSIERYFEPYPVMTVFKDIPDLVVDRQNRYTITIPDVPSLFVEEFACSGTFELNVYGERFEKCFIEKSGEDERRRCTVTVIGYRPYTDKEDEEIPVDPVQ